MLDSSVHGGDAPNGGGGIFNDTGQTLTITNSAVFDNLTEAGANVQNNGTATINHSTIALTFGTSEGLINSDTGTLNMTHTIIADTAFGDDCVNDGTFNDNGYNLIEDSSCITAGTSFGGDPNLDSSPADNGGPIQTIALGSPSIAIDAGDPSISTSLTHDIRGPGFPRILDGDAVGSSTIDIGAFEYDTPQGSSPFTVNSLDDDAPLDPLHGLGDPGDSTAVACSAQHCTLREAMMASNALAGSDTINFDVPGSGDHVFQPTTPLPTISENLWIDGTSEPDGNVILDGSSAGLDTDGLILDSSFINITGLAIRNFDGNGLVVLSGNANTFYNNTFYGNGGLGVDLNDDGVTPNDYLDADGGPNNLENAPVIQRVIISGTETIVQGFYLGKPNLDHQLYFYSNTQCDDSFYGQGEQRIGADLIATDANGYAAFQATLPLTLTNGTGVTGLVGFDMDLIDGSSEFSRCIVAGPNNDTWPNAYEIPLLPPGGDQKTGSTQQYISRPGQASWFRFQVAPNSTAIVDLTDLPANYDLVLFRDIGQTYESLTTPTDLDDLIKLNAEFAPDMFSPDMFSPDMFSPDMFSPDMFSPDMFSPDMFSPDMFSPDMFSPDMFSPDMFSPDMFSPDMFSPDMFSPDMFSPDMFSPDMFSPDMFSPDMVEPGQRYFINAQAQSAIAVSGFDGTGDETVIANTWAETGFFYIRVNGRNGVFNPTSPFTLNVTLLGNECLGLTDFEFNPDTSAIEAAGDQGIENLILVDNVRLSAVYSDTVAMDNALSTLETEVNGQIVDVSQFAAVNAANTQSDEYPECVFAKNLVAYAIKDIVDAYRLNNPVDNVVVIGNDDIIPFFRYRDGSLLANEDGFFPPVEDGTASQASLRLGYVLSQDTYGASIEIDRKNTSIPIPELPVGRLVETPTEITTMINAFLSTNGTVPSPSTALVTGYDFLDDGADAVQSELASGLGSGGTVNTLISAADVAPVNAWNADQMRNALLENGRHDLIYLAGHFSASSALAADYETRVLASEIADSFVDMTNSIVFSAGCHSGYNTVNEHGVPNVYRRARLAPGIC